VSAVEAGGRGGRARGRLVEEERVLRRQHWADQLADAEEAAARTPPSSDEHTQVRACPRFARQLAARPPALRAWSTTWPAIAARDLGLGAAIACRREVAALLAMSLLRVPRLPPGCRVLFKFGVPLRRTPAGLAARRAGSSGSTSAESAARRRGDEAPE